MNTMKLPSFFQSIFLFEMLPFMILFSFKLTNSISLKEENSDASVFSNNFLFGTASSSYQGPVGLVEYEGAFLSDGKGLSNWDIFTHNNGTILDGSNGDIAVDHYHLYQVDIDLMENLGVNSFRFSISWSRILPKGGYGNVNIAGINHYNDLIDRLLHKGIQPFVTLCHYDIPQELEERYGSWLSPEIQNEFEYYADICFQYFGDRVKYWITINEPNVMAIRGYRTGIYPPSRCSVSFRHCSEGDSEKEPLIAAHNMILSHAAAVSIYRTKYQNVQGGSIGIVMNAVWFEPFSDSAEDKSAAERTLSFYMNWFFDPIVHGKYPEEMHNILGSLLPVFVEKDLEKLKFGLDFIGINHYTSFYSKDCIYSECGGGLGVSKSEGRSLWTPLKDGKLIGKSTAVDWLYVYPQGMEKIVTYLKDRYNNTPMFICENGFGDANNLDSSVADSLNDVERVVYMKSHLDSLAKAIRNGADVRGYFAWSLLDNFEWTYGYTIRFGLHYVDYSSLERIPRLSATWYKDFISNVRGLQKW